MLNPKYKKIIDCMAQSNFQMAIKAFESFQKKAKNTEQFFPTILKSFILCHLMKQGDAIKTLKQIPAEAFKQLPADSTKFLLKLLNYLQIQHQFRSFLLVPEDSFDAKILFHLNLKDYQSAAKVFFIKAQKDKSAHSSLAFLYLVYIAQKNISKYQKFAQRHKQSFGISSQLLQLYPELTQRAQEHLNYNSGLKYVTGLKDEVRTLKFLQGQRQRKHIFNIKIKQVQLRPSLELLKFYQQKIHASEDSLTIQQNIKLAISIQVALDLKPIQHLQLLIQKRYMYNTLAQQLVSLLPLRLHQALQHFLKIQQHDPIKAQSLNRNIYIIKSQISHSKLLFLQPSFSLDHKDLALQAVLQMVANKQELSLQLKSFIQSCLKESEQNEPNVLVRWRLLQCFHLQADQRALSLSLLADLKSIQILTLGFIYLKHILINPYYDDIQEVLLQKFSKAQHQYLAELGRSVHAALQNQRYKSMIQSVQFNAFLRCSVGRAGHLLALIKYFKYKNSKENCLNIINKLKTMLQGRLSFSWDIKLTSKQVMQAGFLSLYDNREIMSVQCEISQAQLNDMLSLQQLNKIQKKVSNLQNKYDFKQFLFIQNQFVSQQFTSPDSAFNAFKRFAFLRINLLRLIKFQQQSLGLQQALQQISDSELIEIGNRMQQVHKITKKVGQAAEIFKKYLELLQKMRQKCSPRRIDSLKKLISRLKGLK